MPGIDDPALRASLEQWVAMVRGANALEAAGRYTEADGAFMDAKDAASDIVHNLCAELNITVFEEG